MNRTEAMTDAGACAPNPAELRERALAEFEEGYKSYPADAAWALSRQLDRIRATEAADEERKRLSLEAVKDDDAVARMAHAMRAKLTMTRETRGGWWTEGCTNAGLATMLRVCVEKGDPVDVANLCAFLHARGERIPSANRPAETGICNKAAPAKALDGLDAQYKQALSDPNADNDYLRGFNNGIICAHATIFDHEPDYIVPQIYTAEELARAARCREQVETALPPHLRSKTVETIAKAECDAEIGRLVPRSVPENTHTVYDVYGVAAEWLTNGPRPVPGADVPASYVVGAIEFAGELNKARRKFGPMASAHEGLAVIAEEFDELKAIVWQKQSEHDYAALRKETVQLGAMVLAFLLEVVNTGNRR